MRNRPKGNKEEHAITLGAGDEITFYLETEKGHGYLPRVLTPEAERIVELVQGDKELLEVFLQVYLAGKNLAERKAAQTKNAEAISMALWALENAKEGVLEKYG